jgi:hypothetical protein
MLNNPQLLPESHMRLSDTELLDIFPQAKQIVLALIKELGQKKDQLLDKIIEQNASINAESTNDSYRYFWKSWLIQPIRDELKSVDSKLARLQRQLRLINGNPIPTGAITNEMIQAAKAVPIESFIDQKFKPTGQMLVGLCPFVEERTASFHIYTKGNRCWCFGCQQGYNAIDTYMKLNDCDFKEAVLALIGGVR